MNKSLTITEDELSSMPEDKALEVWRKINTPKFPQRNKIVLNNQKFIDDTANPDFGKIFAYKYEDENGEQKETITELKTGEEFYPILTRIQITGGYVGDKQKYRCKEVYQGQPIEVIEIETRDVVFSGNYQEAKEQYNLAYKQAVYVYYEGSIYRWLLGGGETRSSWFEMQNIIRELNNPHTVKVTKVIPQKSKMTHWNELKFELGKEFDVKTALGLQIQVSKLLGESELQDPKESIKEDEKTDLTDDDLPF
jgi:hypothetical protein